MHQHDIDIIEPGKISVFNNNRTTRADGDIVLGLNELLLFDLEKGSLQRHYSDSMQKYEIMSINQGLHDFSSSGNVMVDETNYGRLLMFDQEGNMYWEFINRAEDEKIYTTNWSRLAPKENGMSAAIALNSSACNF